jgi:hypothetical protein
MLPKWFPDSAQNSCGWDMAEFSDESAPRAFPKTSVMFSIIGIVAAVLLFAAGPVIATHQAWA